MCVEAVVPSDIDQLNSFLLFATPLQLSKVQSR
jgi:hypothetical protein